jgi:2-methylcitrate dehydratase PrpD
VFGAAAAVGRILGLSVRQMTWALGIAATQAAGLREMFGTMCKPFHPGRAAQNGLTAAFLAANDFTSSERAIEAPRGFANVLAAGRNFSEITDGLGLRWELALNTYKPFACGIVIHPIIDGCLRLRNTHGLTGEEIDAIALRVNPLVLELTGKTSPQTGLEGKFSVYHSAAIAILFGAAGVSGYSDAMVCNARVQALRDKVRATADHTVREDAAHIAIRLKNGKTIGLFVEHAVGSLERPMSDADLEAKFRGLVDGILSPAETEALIRLCWSIKQFKDAGDLPRKSVPAGG